MSPLDHDAPTTGIDPLQELGKQLPWDRPDASRREAVRSSLLVAAADSPPRRSGRAVLVGAGFLAGALAAAAVALVLVHSSSPSSPIAPIAPIASVAPIAHESYAQIESSSVAELEHTSTPTPSGTDEIVRVRAGKVRLAVPAVRAGDRVRTKTGNGEVEGTGAYEVIVANDKLTSVRVASGTAKVIVDGQTIVLASGETWTAPIVTADLSTAAPTATAKVVKPVIGPQSESRSEPRSKSHAEPRTEPRATTVAPEASPSISTGAPSASTPIASSTEQHFRSGWALLRDNKYSAAADELAIAASGDEPLASDARYFQAVALTKAGRVKEAEAVLVAFLDRASASTRRGRAAVMLGRLIAARGDATSARAWFVSAIGDPDVSVSGAANAELAKIDHAPR